jgi:hypothetical protein
MIVTYKSVYKHVPKTAVILNLKEYTACSMHGRDCRCIDISDGKPEEKRPLIRPIGR